MGCKMPCRRDTFLKTALQILCSDSIGVVGRGSECDWEVVIYRVEEGLSSVSGIDELGKLHIPQRGSRCPIPP